MYGYILPIVYCIGFVSSWYIFMGFYVREGLLSSTLSAWSVYYRYKVVHLRLFGRKLSLLEELNFFHEFYTSFISR